MSRSCCFRIIDAHITPDRLLPCLTPQYCIFRPFAYCPSRFSLKLVFQKVSCAQDSCAQRHLHRRGKPGRGRTKEDEGLCAVVTVACAVDIPNWTRRLQWKLYSIPRPSSDDFPISLQTNTKRKRRTRIPALCLLTASDQI